MKRMLIIAVVLISFVLLTGSSVTAGVKINKGFKIGLSMSKAIGDGADLIGTPDYRKALGMGIYIGFKVSQSVIIQPEFLFMMKGTMTGTGSTYEVNYFEIPIVMKISLSNTSKVAPYITIGPALAFKLNAKIRRDGTSDIDLENIKSSDLGFSIGGGVDFVKSSKVSTSLDVRYTFGLSDATDDNRDIKNSNLAFTFGFSF